MTIHTTLHKLPVSLSQSQWSSIVDTRSVPSLLVPSPLDGVLYAEAGWPTYLLEIQTSCYSENRCQSVLWQRIIPVKGESFQPGGGVISALGVNDRGVIHVSDNGYFRQTKEFLHFGLASLCRPILAYYFQSMNLLRYRIAVLQANETSVRKLQISDDTINFRTLLI